MEYASKTEAINGADNTKIMTPLRVKQSILANSQGGGGGIIEETDPVFSQSPAFIITQDDIEKWNSFSDGSKASKLIFVEESDGSYTLRKAGQ